MSSTIAEPHRGGSWLGHLENQVVHRLGDHQCGPRQRYAPEAPGHPTLFQAPDRAGDEGVRRRPPGGRDLQRRLFADSRLRRRFAFIDNHIALGTPCEVDVRGKMEPATVVNKRFFKREKATP